MLTKIKCWVFGHNIKLVTRKNPFEISLLGVQQSVVCDNCKKQFVYVDWDK